MAHESPDAAEPTQEEIREFGEITRPYLYFASDAMAKKFLRRRPRGEVRLCDGLVEKLGGQGPFQRFVAQGDFAPLASHAVDTAAVVGEQLELTLPRVFAAHALASVLAQISTSELDALYSHTQDRTTYFLTQLATNLALQVPHSYLLGASSPQLFKEAIDQRVGEIAKSIAPKPEWLQQKMLVLADRLSMRRHVAKVIAAESPVATDDLSELRRHNRTLSRELDRRGHYNFESYIHEGVNSNWGMRDITELRAELADAARAVDSPIRPDLWLPAMVMWAVEQEKSEPGPFLPAAASGEADYNGVRRFAFMDGKGELFADMYGAMPLQALYEQGGKTENYETLRQFLLQQRFDHTVSPAVVARTRENTRRLFGEFTLDEPHASGSVPSDLLLPRISALRASQTPEDL